MTLFHSLLIVLHIAVGLNKLRVKGDLRIAIVVHFPKTDPLPGCPWWILYVAISLWVFVSS